MSGVDEDLIEACGDDPGQVCRWVFDLTDSAATADTVEWLVARPVKIVLIVLAAWVANRLVRRAITRFVAKVVRDSERRDREDTLDPVRPGAAPTAVAQLAGPMMAELTRVERARQRAETLGAVLRSLATVVITTVAVLIVLGEFDVSLAPLLASAGIAGVALGFGAQSLVGDFLSGFFMLAEDQFGVGDVVDVGDAVGVVEGVTLRVTRIRDVEGTLWFVPNGQITRVANRSQRWARAVLDVDVAYDTDIDRASEVMKAVADEVWREAAEQATILEEPEVWGVERFAADSIAIRLVVKTDPGEQWTTARVLRRRIKHAFDEAGIEIPFPQRTVWLREGDPGA